MRLFELIQPYNRTWSPLQKMLQMTGKDVHYIGSEKRCKTFYNIIPFVKKKHIFLFIEETVEASMPITMNARLFFPFSYL